MVFLRTWEPIGNTQDPREQTQDAWLSTKDYQTYERLKEAQNTEENQWTEANTEATEMLALTKSEILNYNYTTYVQ